MGPAIQPPLSAPAKDFSKEKLTKFNVFLAETDSANELSDIDSGEDVTKYTIKTKAIMMHIATEL